MKIFEFFKNQLFLIFIFILLLLGFLGALGIDSVKTFDKCSNDVILSNLIYNQTYDESPAFIQIYGACGIDDYHTPFYEKEIVPKEAFHSYSSSIVIQGKIYRILNDILPFSPKINLKIFYSINVLLISFVLTYIITWLKKITNTTAAFTLTIIVAFFSPNLLSLGQNLYWIGWTLFVPLAGMIFYINSNLIHTNKKNFFAFLTAFLCCSVKLLCYFEFVTTVMISMMIPFIYYYMKKGYNIKKMLIKALYPTSGALCSFISVCIYKFILLTIDLGSLSLAKDRFIAPIIYRIIGSKNNSEQVLNIAGSARITDVVNMYLNTTAFNFLGLTVSFRDTVIITTVSLFVACILLKDKELPEDTKHNIQALIICTVLSLIASLSWFIIGKPHAYIHTSQCLTNWYIPFILFATVFICYICSTFLKYKLNLKSY